MPKRLHGHHQIFNRGRTLSETGLPVLVTGIEHQLSCTGGSHNPRHGVRSSERPLPAAREQAGVRQRRERQPDSSAAT